MLGLITAAVLVVPCQYEDGSEMLYSKRYSICQVATGRTTKYTASIDRKTETAKGAWLTYTFLTGTRITKIEKDWVEK